MLTRSISRSLEKNSSVFDYDSDVTFCSEYERRVNNSPYQRSQKFGLKVLNKTQENKRVIEMLQNMQSKIRMHYQYVKLMEITEVSHSIRVLQELSLNKNVQIRELVSRNLEKLQKIHKCIIAFEKTFSGELNSSRVSSTNSNSLFQISEDITQENYRSSSNVSIKGISQLFNVNQNVTNFANSFFTNTNFVSQTNLKNNSQNQQLNRTCEKSLNNAFSLTNNNFITMPNRTQSLVKNNTENYHLENTADKSTESVLKSTSESVSLDAAFYEDSQDWGANFISQTQQSASPTFRMPYKSKRKCLTKKSVSSIQEVPQRKSSSSDSSYKENVDSIVINRKRLTEDFKNKQRKVFKRIENIDDAVQTFIPETQFLEKSFRKEDSISLSNGSYKNYQKQIENVNPDQTFSETQFSEKNANDGNKECFNSHVSETEHFEPNILEEQNRASRQIEDYQNSKSESLNIEDFESEIPFTTIQTTSNFNSETLLAINGQIIDQHYETNDSQIIPVCEKALFTPTFEHDLSMLSQQYCQETNKNLSTRENENLTSTSFVKQELNGLTINLTSSLGSAINDLREMKLPDVKANDFKFSMVNLERKFMDAKYDDDKDFDNIEEINEITAKLANLQMSKMNDRINVTVELNGDDEWENLLVNLKNCEIKK